MSLKDFWLSVFLLGCIVQPALRWLTKTLWLWFVYRSETRARIWWQERQAHAERVLEESKEFFRNPMP